MKQIPSDKYTVAWFKLAECIARGEKERALGVYRLLSHSFNDDAYRVQLEGDILFSFDDIAGALEKYVQAAHIYKTSSRLLEAAVTYEHMLGLVPERNDYLREIIELYRMLSLPDKVLNYECRSIRLSIEQNNLFEASQLLKECDKKNALKVVTLFHEQLALAAIKKEMDQVELIRYHLTRAVQGLFLYYDENALHRFLSYLEQYNETYYLEALESIEKSNKN